MYIIFIKYKKTIFFKKYYCKKYYKIFLLFVNKFLKRIFRSIAGIILTKNRKYHKTVLKGRIEGFNKYK